MSITYKLIMYLAGICTSIIPLIIGFFMKVFNVPMILQLFGFLVSGLLNGVMLSMLIRPKQ